MVGRLRSPRSTVCFLAIFLTSSLALLCAADFTPPATKADPVTEVLHGTKITDPYRWLEDQDSQATREWLTAQERFARAYLDAIPDRKQIRNKLESLTMIDDVGAPFVCGKRYFLRCRRADEDRASLCMPGKRPHVSKR